MTGDLCLRALTDHDLPALQALLEADPAYTRRVTGAAPAAGEAHDLLTGRPPGLPTEQKLVLGAFDECGLAAVLDVLRGWPDPSTVHIGLLQVHADRKREGIGRRAHNLLDDMLGQWPEITTLRASIVATNAAHAEPFWAALGYRPSEPPRPYEAGRIRTHVTAWTRSLAHHAAWPRVMDAVTSNARRPPSPSQEQSQ